MREQYGMWVFPFLCCGNYSCMIIVLKYHNSSWSLKHVFQLNSQASLSVSTKPDHLVFPSILLLRIPLHLMTADVYHSLPLSASQLKHNPTHVLVKETLTIHRDKIWCVFARQHSILYRLGKMQQEETRITGCRELISKPLLGKLQSSRKKKREIEG